MNRSLGLLLVLLVLISGCGGSPTTNAKATTTTKQVASIMARHKQEILDAIAYEDRCSGECLFAANVLSRYQKIAAMADSLNQNLEAAKPVDKEITGLVSTTQATLNKVSTTWGSFRSSADRNAGGSIQACATEWAANEKAWRAMKPMFAAWSPYGV